MSILRRGALGAAVLLLACPALAHVVFERPEASADSTYRAVLRVTHGCKGSPTTSLRVTLPDGAVGARPMPKPGWTVATVRAPYPKPVPGPHGTLTEGVREITWSGGSLPDDFFDEFVFSVRLSDAFRPGDVAFFPVEQLCREGAHRWVEVPAPGGSASALAEPAPAVRIVAAASDATPTPASVTRAGDLTIETPWLRATPGGATVAGGYVRIRNAGAAPDRLVGTSIPLAARGEVHEMATVNGVATMREVSGGLAVPAGGTVELKPGGLHLMFLGLKGPLKEGESVRGTLLFEKAGSVEVTFAVGGMGARGAPMGAGHQH